MVKSPKQSGVKMKSEQKFASHLNRFVRNFGLFVALVCYVGFGAVIFHKLEGPNELDRQTALKELLLESQSNFSQIVFNMVLQNPGEYDFNSTWFSALDAYDKIIEQVASEGMSILEPEIKSHWNYVDSGLFACTVITTIGYGNVTPRTEWGRAFCMLFALYGIPLTLIVLADVGKLIALGVSLLCQRCRPKFPAQIIKPSSILSRIDGKSATVIGSVLTVLLYIAAGGYAFTLSEGWSLLDSFYFCFITMTTIGFGDLIPEHMTYRVLSTVYILFGLALTSTAIELVRNQYAESWKKVQEQSSRHSIEMAESLQCGGQSR